jgi:chromosome segregation ATPase
VSVDSIQSVSGWKGVSSALKEIRDCHADTWAFFHGIFEELNLFSISLDARKNHLAQSLPASEGNSQAAAPVSDDRLHALLSQREADREDIRETRETVKEQVAQLAAIASELASSQSVFQANFTQIREEIAKTREAAAAQAIAIPAPEAGGNGELERKLAELERQHASLEQDRAVLEKELESVRNRAADLAESLSEQKRLTVQQQTQGNSELQRMRELLESLARREPLAKQTRDDEPPPAPAEPPTNAAAAKSQAAPASADPVLGLVLAQFEMLQQDRARRRS